METKALSAKWLLSPRRIEWREGVCGNYDNLPVTGSVSPDTFAYLLELCGLKGKRIEKPELSRDEILRLIIGKTEKVPSAPEPEFSGEEAYSLQISPDGISLAARTKSGLANGLKALARLTAVSAELPCLTAQDAPAADFRGVHLCIFNPNDGTEKEDTSPESIRKMMKLAAMSGYKYVMLEFWGMFPYARRPYAVWPNELYTREVVDSLISYAIDDLHITPLPCQNLTSHAGWSRIVSRKHVVLDQRPDLGEMWVPGGWCFATENPDTQAYLRDIMEDLLDAFRNPPFLHACCDKCFGFASTEEDRTKPADLLFGNHLCRINSFLQHRGTRMIMWSDMLYSSMDALYWKCSPAVADMLPRNILMNLWTHNDPGQHWHDVEFFESKGFQTIYSPFLEESGVRSMNAVCQRNNSHGILQTTWHRPQTARKAVALSGALQWSGVSDYTDDGEEFTTHWYS
jgi:hypothetical protein